MSQFDFDEMDIEDYDPSLCPYCESGNIEALDDDGESVKKHCYDCDGDFILWYDEPYDEMPIEVTDGRGNRLF